MDHFKANLLGHTTGAAIAFRNTRSDRLLKTASESTPRDQAMKLTERHQKRASAVVARAKALAEAIKG